MRSTQTLIRGVTMLAWLTMVLLVTECHAQGSQAGPAQRSPQPNISRCGPCSIGSATPACNRPGKTTCAPRIEMVRSPVR